MKLNKPLTKQRKKVNNMKFPTMKSMNATVIRTRVAVKEQAPLIMTVAGMAGLGYTAYRAYKARDRVRVITEELEYRRAMGEEIKPLEVVTRVSGAVATPVIVGTLSLASIFGSYHVLNNRLQVVSTALATVSAEHRAYQQYVKKQYPELLPVANEQEEVFASADEVNKKKPVMVTVNKNLDVNVLKGVLFSKSAQYVSDDADYGRVWLLQQSEIISDTIQRLGSISLNDVWDILEINSSEVDRSLGCKFGFTDGSYFDLDLTLFSEKDADGYPRPNYIITWPTAKPIMDVNRKAYLTKYVL